MRILICAQRDLTVCLTLNRLLPTLARHQVQVLLADVPDLKTPVTAINLLRFLDRELPNKIIFPLLDRQSEPLGMFLSFGHLARTYDAPMYIITDINGGDGYDLARAFRPDLIYSIRFSLIFAEHVLQMPKYGVLNTHSGALPHYAGHYTPFHAMRAGDRTVGCTLFIPDKGLDTGPVIATRYLPVNTERSVLWHIHQLYSLLIDPFLDVLSELEAGAEPKAQPQDFNQRKYWRLPTVEEVADFETKGLRIVNPEEYAHMLHPFLALSS